MPMITTTTTTTTIFISKTVTSIIAKLKSNIVGYDATFSFFEVDPEVCSTTLLTSVACTYCSDGYDRYNPPGNMNCAVRHENNIYYSDEMENQKGLYSFNINTNEISSSLTTNGFYTIDQDVSYIYARQYSANSDVIIQLNKSTREISNTLIVPVGSESNMLFGTAGNVIKSICVNNGILYVCGKSSYGSVRILKYSTSNFEYINTLTLPTHTNCTIWRHGLLVDNDSIYIGSQSTLSGYLETVKKYSHDGTLIGTISTTYDGLNFYSGVMAETSPGMYLTNSELYIVGFETGNITDQKIFKYNKFDLAGQATFTLDTNVRIIGISHLNY